MGTRLRYLRKEMKGKRLSDGRFIGGTGRLSDKNVIRQNSNSVHAMKKAIVAIIFHCSIHGLL